MGRRENLNASAHFTATKVKARAGIDIGAEMPLVYGLADLVSKKKYKDISKAIAMAYVYNEDGRNFRTMEEMPELMVLILEKYDSLIAEGQKTGVPYHQLENESGRTERLCEAIDKTFTIFSQLLSSSYLNIRTLPEGISQEAARDLVRNKRNDARGTVQKFKEMIDATSNYVNLQSEERQKGQSRDGFELAKPALRRWQSDLAELDGILANENGQAAGIRRNV